MAVPEARPNHTIYINNLNEKIKKDGEFSADCRLQAISHERAPRLSSASTSLPLPSLLDKILELTPPSLHMLLSLALILPKFILHSVYLLGHCRSSLKVSAHSTPPPGGLPHLLSPQEKPV